MTSTGECEHQELGAFDQRLDELTLEFLGARHQIFAMLYRLLGDSHVAEDLLQEVWMTLAKTVRKGDDIEAVVPWCRGVARHLVQKHWRKQGSRAADIDIELLDLVEQTCENDQLAMELKASRQSALERCLAKMPEASRQFLEKRYTDKLSYERLSSQLGASVNALMMKASRLRKKLLECIQVQMHDQEVLP